jgi:CheY-like chemotaxis protein
MGLSFNYIIIDDSKIDIFIASKMIETAFPGAVIRSYLNASDALEVVQSEGAQSKQTVILIDISMPIMDGFDFMDEFEKLPDEVKDTYIACFLTSSINESDIAKAKTFKSIRLYLNKPLTHINIQKLISTIKQQS